ncbi:hypothetical protein [Mycobacteroides abscessus]|uniref:hypothetical protein n=5 Tax=Mycobacteroides abscessus TaxID=36809 RepID=UPI00148FD841|nr:hypothetical protein [Mycobacteroides abscessus]
MTSPPPPSTDFTEFPCISNPDKLLARFIPIMILFGVGAGLLVMLALGFTMNPAIYVTGSALAGFSTIAIAYWVRRNRILAENRAKRLVLSQTGIRRVDATTIVDMPWQSIHSLQNASYFVRKQTSPSTTMTAGVIATAGTGIYAAAGAAGAIAYAPTAPIIVGRAGVEPAPGARLKDLRAYDKLTGRALSQGRGHIADDARIYPSDYEDNWGNGTIGQWLRQFRPDLIQ